MTSELKQNLSKHELILERYKAMLNSDKKKPKSEIIEKNNIYQMGNLIEKLTNIKENIYPNSNNFLTINSTSEMKIENLLNKTNNLYDQLNPIKSKHHISSREQVKNIIDQNVKNKSNENDHANKITQLMNKYEIKNQNIHDGELIIDGKVQNLNKNSPFREKSFANLKNDNKINSMNLKNLIATNNNVIENIKKKYAFNVQSQNNKISIGINNTNPNQNIDNINRNIFGNFNTINVSSFKDNNLNFPNKKNNDEKNNNNINNQFLQENFKKGYTNENIILKRNRFLEDIDQDNIETINKINQLRAKYVDGLKSSNTKALSQDFTNAENEDTEMINLFTKYIKKGKENEFCNDEIIDNNSTFEKKLEGLNKKIDNVNFTFQKNLTEESAVDSNVKSQNDTFTEIYNKKNEADKKEILEKERNEKSNKEIYDKDVGLYKNNNDGKSKDFIKKINFIEDQLNRIESLIKFEENENNLNNEIKKENIFQLKNEYSSKYLKLNKIDEKWKDPLSTNNLESPDSFIDPMNLNNELKSCKKSVFSQINKNDDFTSDEENQTNNILLFADNIKNLKNLKEKNSQLIEEFEGKSEKKKTKKKKIPPSKSNSLNSKDNKFETSLESELSENEGKLFHNQDKSKSNDIQNSVKDTKKILNDLIASENLFEKKDLIDEKISYENTEFNSKNKFHSNMGIQNSSTMNNMTLSYSISSNENSLSDDLNEEKNYSREKKIDLILLKDNVFNQSENDYSKDRLSKYDKIFEDNNFSFENNYHKSCPKDKKSPYRIKVPPAKNLITFEEFFSHD